MSRKANNWITAGNNLRKGSWWKTSQNVRSRGSESMRPKVRPWRQRHIGLQPPARRKTFVPIYASGVMLGI